MNVPLPPDPSSGPPPIPPSLGAVPPMWESEAPLVPWTPLPDAEPAWPTALGITAIVFGAYGMISHAAGFASTKFLGNMTRSLPGVPGFDENVLGLMNRYMLYNGTGCLVLGVLLIAGGIALLRRRPKARALLLTWAVARILLSVATAPLMMAYTGAMMTSLTVSTPITVSPVPAPGAPAGTPASPPPAPAPPASTIPAPGPTATSPARSPATPPFSVHAMTAAMGRISAYAGLATASLGPIFALIWFNLRRIRTHMGTWAKKTAAPV